jgi:hypothetical protein
MHPTALLKGVGLRSVKAGLSGAAERAREAGVDALPAISVAGELICGPGCLDAAMDMLGQLEASR